MSTTQGEQRDDKRDEKIALLREAVIDAREALAFGIVALEIGPRNSRFYDALAKMSAAHVKCRTAMTASTQKESE